MMRLQNMIDELTTRADDSDLIALLATSRKTRLENVALARELRDVVGALKRELHYRQSLADLTIGRNSSWIKPARCGAPHQAVARRRARPQAGAGTNAGQQALATRNLGRPVI
jgi:hypothetical protein